MARPPRTSSASRSYGTLTGAEAAHLIPRGALSEADAALAIPRGALSEGDVARLQAAGVPVPALHSSRMTGNGILSEADAVRMQGSRFLPEAPAGQSGPMTVAEAQRYAGGALPARQVSGRSSAPSNRRFMSEADAARHQGYMSQADADRQQAPSWWNWLGF